MNLGFLTKLDPKHSKPDLTLNPPQPYTTALGSRLIEQASIDMLLNWGPIMYLPFAPVAGWMSLALRHIGSGCRVVDGENLAQPRVPKILGIRSLELQLRVRCWCKISSINSSNRALHNMGFGGYVFVPRVSKSNDSPKPSSIVQKAMIILHILRIQVVVLQFCRRLLVLKAWSRGDIGTSK